MGLYKIFRETFNDVMTRHGFVCQGNAFLRIVNGEILQAVTVKALTSYQINLWCSSLYDEMRFFHFEYDSKKPYWIEDFGSLTFNGYKDWPGVIPLKDPETHEVLLYITEPYFKKNEAPVIENFKCAAKYMESFYIPQLDQISDINSFLDWVSMDEDVRQVRLHFEPSCSFMCRKAYIDGNFEYGRAYLNAKKERALREPIIHLQNLVTYRKMLSLEERKKRYGANFEIPDFDAELNKLETEYDNEIKLKFPEFIEAEKSNDFTHIREYTDSVRDKNLKAIYAKYPKLLKKTFQ